MVPTRDFGCRTLPVACVVDESLFVRHCRERTHVPFRDSKLTRILEPALGGNSRTAIICTITPAAMHAEETISTLKFATRAKSIQTKAVVNEDLDDQALLKR